MHEKRGYLCRPDKVSGSIAMMQPALSSQTLITGQGKGHQLSGLKAGDTWLAFGVLFKGEEGMHWVREELLSCDNLVRSCSALLKSPQSCLGLSKTSWTCGLLVGDSHAGSRHGCLPTASCQSSCARCQCSAAYSESTADCPCKAMPCASRTGPLVSRMMACNSDVLDSNYWHSAQ